MRGRPKGSKDKKQRKCKYTPEVLKKLGDKLLKWIQEPQNWWLGDFAHQNDMYRTQLDELAGFRRSDYFTHALKKAKSIQETKLFQLGLARKVDTGMAIFALKNVAGWRDNNNYFDQSQKTYVQIYRPEKYARQDLETASRCADRSV